MPRRRSLAPETLGVLAVALLGLVVGAAIGGGLPRSKPPLVLGDSPTTSTTALTTTVPSVATPDQTVVAIMGDSFVGGSQMNTSQDATWPELVRRQLLDDGEADRVDVYGMGGSGYIAPGQREATFEQAVNAAVSPDADLVVMMGGLNDTSLGATQADVADAVDRYLAAVAARAPDAVVVIVGVVWPNSTPVPEAVTVNGIIRDRVEASGTVDQFVDAMAEAWFAGDNEDLIGSDGTHPTDDGHAFIAEQMLPRIRTALGLA